MITATIQNIVLNGIQVLVYVLFSNSTNPVIYTFGVNDTQDTINAVIQNDLNNINSANTVFNNVQPLIGTMLQPLIVAQPPVI